MIDFDDRSLTLEDLECDGFDLTSPGELHVFTDSERCDYALHSRDSRYDRFTPTNLPSVGNLMLEASQSETIYSNLELDPLGWSSDTTLQTATKLSKTLEERIEASPTLKQGSTHSSTTSGASGESSILTSSDESCLDSIGRGAFECGNSSFRNMKITDMIPTIILQTKLECDLDFTLKFSLNSSASPPKSPKRSESLVLPAKVGEESSIPVDESTVADGSLCRDPMRLVPSLSTRISALPMGSRVK